MIVIETCPECGHDLMDVIVATYPSIPRKECFNCGWSWTGEREEIIRVLFGGNSLNREFERNYLGRWNISNPPENNNFGNEACDGCPSNPKNGGTGICFCTLGQQPVY